MSVYSGFMSSWGTGFSREISQWTDAYILFMIKEYLDDISNNNLY